MDLAIVKEGDNVVFSFRRPLASRSAVQEVSGGARPEQTFEPRTSGLVQFESGYAKRPHPWLNGQEKNA